METTKRLFISLLVFLSYTAGAWAIEQDSDGYYLIGSVQDWKDFAALVQTTPTANAKMTADVDLGNDQTMIGTSSMKYQGTFDGQAHTLTVNYFGSSKQFIAPLHYVDGGTILNLRIDGIVSSSSEHLSGLIGKAYNEITIENCLVAAEIKMNSDYAGGFVGNGGSQMYNDPSKVVFKNCLFAGTFTGVGGSRNTAAGFYGWGKSTPVFINCLENGTYNNVSGYNPYMYEGTDKDNTETTANSYYKHGDINLEGISDASAMTDGEIVSNLGDAWVIDGILNMPMLKIFANEETEQPSEALNGVFTINASGEKVSFAKGNLQKIGSTYQFAEHQYDYFGTNQSDTHRDMYAFLDYSNPDNGESWSMLSWEEWKYLFATRSVTNTLSDGARYTMATLGGTYKGLIIFPDYYTHPEGTDFTPGVFDSNSNYTAKVSLEGWAMMEAAGCVFLPAAGWCSAGIDWYGVGEEVGYMSSTPTGSKYYSPYFTPEGVYLDEISRQITWTSIRLVMRLQPLTYTVPARGVGTFSSEVNIHLPEGLNAHYCKTYYAERSAISVVNISSGVVPANTGVLLSGTPGETFNLYPTPETADDLEGNALVAVTKPVHISPTKGDYTNFMMKGGNFVKIADESYTVKMPANRAYLPLLTEAISGSNAKEIMLYWDDGETTGIESLTPGPSPKGAGSIYNLNGQKLSAPQKGINIINGRKVIVK